MYWWNELSEAERLHWLWVSESAEVWQAWSAYKRYQAVKQLSSGVMA